MKKLFILISLFVSISVHAQVDLQFFKNFLLYFSFEQVDDALRKEEYSFDKGEKEEKDDYCVQHYMFRKYNPSAYDYIEVISNCNRSSIKLLLLYTRNEKLYYEIKSQCENIEKAKNVEEYIENEVVTIVYQKELYTYRFINDKDGYGKLYVIRVDYKYPWEKYLKGALIHDKK